MTKASYSNITVYAPLQSSYGFLPHRIMKPSKNMNRFLILAVLPLLAAASFVSSGKGTEMTASELAVRFAK